MSLVGLAIVEFYRKKPAEEKGVWIGLLAGSIIIYIPLILVWLG